MPEAASATWWLAPGVASTFTLQISTALRYECPRISSTMTIGFSIILLWLYCILRHSQDCEFFWLWIGKAVVMVELISCFSPHFIHCIPQLISFRFIHGHLTSLTMFYYCYRLWIMNGLLFWLSSPLLVYLHVYKMRINSHHWQYT